MAMLGRTLMMVGWVALATPPVVAGILTRNYVVVAIPMVIAGLGIVLQLPGRPGSPELKAQYGIVGAGMTAILVFVTAAALFGGFVLAYLELFEPRRPGRAFYDLVYDLSTLVLGPVGGVLFWFVLGIVSLIAVVQRLRHYGKGAKT